jgi:serine/threonine protein kinase
MAALQPKDTFGEYTIIRRLGQGGQGTVYEVTDAMGMRWALKISHELQVKSSRDEIRFRKEAQWVDQLRETLPRHCGVFVGEHYGVHQGQLYIKMKLLAGESLAERLEREGRLTVVHAIQLVQSIATAVDLAHRCGALHRDLKPENVFLERCPDGDVRVQVMDWGAVQLRELSYELNETGNFGPVCTPGYAPMEQYRVPRIPLEPVADVYALGVMFYEMLTGYHPFVGWVRGVKAKPAREIEPASSAPLAHHQHANHQHAPTRYLPTESPPSRYSASQGAAPNEQQAAALDATRDTLKDPVDSKAVTPVNLFDVSTPVVGQYVAGRFVGQLIRDHQPFEEYHQPAVQRPAGQVPTPRLTTAEEREAAAEFKAPSLPHENVSSTRTMSHPGVVRRRPPRHFSTAEVLRLQASVIPATLEGLPARLATLIARMLAKSPAQRPPSMRAVAQELAAILKNHRDLPRFATSDPDGNYAHLNHALSHAKQREKYQRWVARYGVRAAGVAAGVALVIAYRENPMVFSKQLDKPEELAAQIVAPPAPTTPPSQPNQQRAISEGIAVDQRNAMDQRNPMDQRPEPQPAVSALQPLKAAPTAAQGLSERSTTATKGERKPLRSPSTQGAGTQGAQTTTGVQTQGARTQGAQTQGAQTQSAQTSRSKAPAEAAAPAKDASQLGDVPPAKPISTAPKEVIWIKPPSVKLPQLTREKKLSHEKTANDTAATPAREERRPQK